jgi:hypothetical protein
MLRIWKVLVSFPISDLEHGGYFQPIIWLSPHTGKYVNWNSVFWYRLRIIECKQQWLSRINITSAHCWDWITKKPLELDSPRVDWEISLKDVIQLLILVCMRLDYFIDLWDDCPKERYSNHEHDKTKDLDRQAGSDKGSMCVWRAYSKSGQPGPMDATETIFFN